MAQVRLVIKIDGRDRHSRRGHGVRGVEAATESDLEYGALTPASRNASSASAVVASKKLGGCSSAAAAWRIRDAGDRVPRVAIGWPSMAKRSSRSTRCGDV
jgi:hypothetical protein